MEQIAVWPASLIDFATSVDEPNAKPREFNRREGNRPSLLRQSFEMAYI